MAQLYFLPYSASYPSAGDYKQRLQDTYSGYKSRYIDSYATGLVHDPSKADDPGTPGFNEDDWATSEGVGYGLTRALYQNDQAYFDKILDATYTYMYNKNGKGLFTWKVDKNGNIDPSDKDSATDADIIITLALIFADTLVKKGHWANTGRNYGGKAQNLINAIYANDIESGRYLKAGDGSYWAGKNIMNPSYFFTAAFKTFEYYQTTWHDWKPIIDQCYKTIQSVHPGGTDGYFYGLSPDWCSHEGAINVYGVGGGPSGNGYDMWYDAIRTPWMLALDSIWYSDSRAISYCQNGMNFLKNKYGNETSAAQSNIMYRMDGTAYGNPQGTWHNELTTSMWSTGAMGDKYNSSMQLAFHTEFSNFSILTASYNCWGNWSGATNYYFNQSLAGFGALVMGGNFVNVFMDLDPPLPSPSITKSQYNSKQVELRWNLVSGASGYKIYRKENANDPFVEIGSSTSTFFKDYSVSEGKTYIYAVGAYDSDDQVGKMSEVSITCNVVAVPRSELLKIYPNPFESEVWIPYQLDRDYSQVTISFYTINGNKIIDCYPQGKSAGVYQDKDRAFRWDGTNGLGEKMKPGVYICSLTLDGKIVAYKKLIKAK